MTAAAWLDWPDLYAPHNARIDALETENAALLHALCHAAIHDGRGGRVGLPGMWKAVLGVRS